MDEKEYQLSIRKEVIDEFVAGMSAKYFHAAIEMDVNDDSAHPIKIKEMEIFALRDVVRDAETMEEVEAISDKLLEYNRDLIKLVSEC
jgi:hypothetical protein